MKIKIGISEVDITVGISLLTCNHLQWTSECIRTLQLYTPPDLYKLSILDNGSEDDTPGFLSSVPYEYVLEKTNKGVAYARNKTFKHLKETYNPDFICLIHNDMLFTENWLTDLLQAYFKIGYPCLLGCAGIIGPETLKLDDAQRGVFAKECRKDLTIPGNLEPRLYPREVINKVGLFDEAYIQQEGEDVDYNVRCEGAGFPALGTYKVIVYHSYALTRPYVEGAKKYVEQNAALLRSKYPKEIIKKCNHFKRTYVYFNGIPFCLNGV